MRIFAGYSALSEYRRDSLLTELQDIASEVTNLHAQHIHFVEGTETLNTDDIQTLQSLLHYGKEWGQSPLIPISSEIVFPDTGTSYNIKNDYTTFVVVPRLGTISPWSSKATDIAHNTGLAITRIERGILYGIEGDVSGSDMHRITLKLYDRMIESILPTIHDCIKLFEYATPKPMTIISVLQHGIDAIREANMSLRLALNEQEMKYLAQSYLDLGRDPSDVELYMFAQANSEHCRHKIFNASWNINGEKQNHSLFSMIRNTTYQSSNGVLSAYKDNAAVIAGIQASCFYPHPRSKIYHYEMEDIDLLMKVETHNHPTAISPYSGSATGVGGEIRDEGATGLGAKTKAGLTGFTVSNLNIPNFIQRWEQKNRVYGKPAHIASALQIMLEAPVGGARFSNEFGRPNLSGYFRTYEQVGYSSNGQEMYGYHKPIMIAGGMGNILRYHINKNTITVGAKLICLGGPAMRIGLSGGTASSVISSDNNAELDFASVQRGNAEMERRCQEVIDRCWQMGRSNPISFIHDVGAGGISNAFPELIKDGDVGGIFELRNVLLGEQGMSPLEIWSNESQERYVIAVPADAIDTFDSICKRERCPYAIVGEAVSEHHLTLNDMYFKNTPVDLPMNILFHDTPKMHRVIERNIVHQVDFDITGIMLDDAIEQVLKIPAVASKSFLITIGDRSITGMVVRDQMVGKWQVPVADCAVTTTGLDCTTGEAMAMGERTPLAVIHAPASGRMAIGEIITNLASADIQCISDIHLSANWMVAAGYSNEDEKLFDTVRAIGMDFCPDLGIAIPVGKDSMSMRTTWKDTNTNTEKSVTSPLSLIVSGFAPVMDTNKTLTPALRTDKGDTVLISVDIANGRNRLGGSCLAQAYNQVGNDVPDADAKSLKAFFETTQILNRKGVIIAYHDRSDGGVITTLLEMAFSGKTGLDIALPQGEAIRILFNEELGAVLQIADSNAKQVIHAYTSVGIDATVIATPNTNDTIVITQNNTTLYTQNRVYLQRVWAELSYRIQALRDNAQCAEQEFNGILDTTNPGLHTDVSFDIDDDVTVPFINTKKPKIAILREQGVNGHVEMAGAFTAAHFEAVDIHMSDLHTGRVHLKDFNALVACGGFSYGDVLGAGGGWAKNILYTPHLREQFEHFFARQDTLALGVCNGCQMFAQLKHLIPGAENWPQFIRNTSEQFESRTSMVRIETSDSVWFDAMAETCTPIPVAHGEGRIMFESQEQESNLRNSYQITLRFVDGYSTPTELYPQNPNGSLDGITGVSAGDGRIQIMMPHPERAYRSITNSWKPDHWGQYGVWMRMFRNARKWLK